MRKLLIVLVLVFLVVQVAGAQDSPETTKQPLIVIWSISNPEGCTWWAFVHNVDGTQSFGIDAMPNNPEPHYLSPFELTGSADSGVAFFGYSIHNIEDLCSPSARLQLGDQDLKVEYIDITDVQVDMSQYFMSTYEMGEDGGILNWRLSHDVVTGKYFPAGSSYEVYFVESYYPSDEAGAKCSDTPEIIHLIGSYSEVVNHPFDRIDCVGSAYVMVYDKDGTMIAAGIANSAMFRK